METTELTDKIKSYILSKIDTIAETNPIIDFSKPFINRAINKKFNKINSVLDLISDDTGNIDISTIIDELIDKIKETKSFKIDTSFIGEVEIGNSAIKLTIPLIDKRIVFDATDLEEFKEAIMTKK